MTLPKGVRTVEQRWGVKGVSATEINDLKLSVSPVSVCANMCVCERVCVCVSVCHRGDIMQSTGLSLKDGLV